MREFAFISRHQPNQDQVDLAYEAGIALTSVGDMDAFGPDLVNHLLDLAAYEGIVCVHPLIAMTALIQGYTVGVFENENRAPEGQKPTFSAKSLRMVTL